MRTKQSRIDNNLEWLLTNADFLSKSKIEEKLEMPSGTLIKFVKGVRGLPENWKEPLSDWVDEFKKPRG